MARNKREEAREERRARRRARKEERKLLRAAKRAAKGKENTGRISLGERITMFLLKLGLRPLIKKINMNISNDLKTTVAAVIAALGAIWAMISGDISFQEAWPYITAVLGIFGIGWFSNKNDTPGPDNPTQ